MEPTLNIATAPDARPRARTDTPGESLLMVTARLHAMSAQQVPLLQGLHLRAVAALRAVEAPALVPALQAQLAAVSALAFDSLVPLGVRDVPSPARWADFRAQVAAVSHATELSWHEIRTLLQAHAAFEGEATQLAFEFGQAARAIEHEARRACAVAIEAQAQLQATARHESGMRQAALTEMARRAGVLAERAGRFEALGAAARQSQRLCGQLRDEREALCDTLRRQAQGFSAPLLKRLKWVVSPTDADPPQTLRLARRARRELQVSLLGALAHLDALDDYVHELHDALDAVAAGAQALAPAASGASTGW